MPDTEIEKPRQFIRHTLMLRHGPLAKGDELLKPPVQICPGCRKHFAEGDFYALVPIGPGPDKAARELCAAGQPYPVVSAPTHWDCATGGA